MTLTVGLTYNQKKEVSPEENVPEDFYAEFDSAETINALKSAIESAGHKVVLIEADENAFTKLKRLKSQLDIVFNIAEGMRGESRESHMPSILEMLGIPYSGSGPLTLAICLDKARTKEILSFHRIKTPEFQIFTDSSEELNQKLKFPLIVKPISEGSSKGIKDDCVVRTDEELRNKISSLLKTYNQPALVEEFLEGREFTVAVMGNTDPVVLPIVEIIFDELPDNANKIYSYEAKWIWDVPSKPLNIFSCPADLPKPLYTQICRTAIAAYKAVNCKDLCRIDIRLKGTTPCIIEMNPLPGMIPNPEDNSCFPKAARAAGIQYNDLINMILYYAAERQGMENKVNSPQEIQELVTTLVNASKKTKGHVLA